MKANTIPSIEDRLAAEVAPRNLLTPLGRGLLTGELTAREYVDALIDHGYTADGIRFLSALLPAREAVWWACLCVQASADPEAQPPEELAALCAIARWVVKPEEPLKIAVESIPSKAVVRIARAVAAAHDRKSPTAALVPRYVSMAVLVAAAQGDSLEALKNQRRFVALGIHVSAGKYLWTEG